LRATLFSRAVCEDFNPFNDGVQPVMLRQSVMLHQSSQPGSLKRMTLIYPKR